MAGITAIFCRSTDDQAATNPAIAYALGAGETDAATAHVAPSPYPKTFLRNHMRSSLARTARVRCALSRINPISAMSRPSASALATIAISRQHRLSSRGASRIHNARKPNRSGRSSCESSLGQAGDLRCPLLRMPRWPEAFMVGVGRGATSRPCWTARIAFPCRDGPPSDQGWLRARHVRARHIPKVCAGSVFLFGRFVCLPLVSTPNAVVAVCQDNASARSKVRRCCAHMVGVNPRADGTGSSRRMGYRILRQGSHRTKDSGGNWLAAVQERSGPRNRF